MIGVRGRQMSEGQWKEEERRERKPKSDVVMWY